MVMSLQEQLKNSGLVDEKKAKQLKRAKLKEEKLARKKQGPGNEIQKQELKQQREAQAAKDRQLNLEKNALAHSAAVLAQINQLVETNRVKPDGDKKYGYLDGGKIKSLWVSQQQIDKLSLGTLCIVKHANSVALVPKAIAAKIEQRDPAVILNKAVDKDTTVEDDYYGKYVIPDDLDW